VKLRSNHPIFKCFLSVFLVFLIFGLGVNWRVGAQSESYILEVEQHWDTFGVGGTCISGGHNLAVADVDGDGVKEIVTGGSSYYLLPNGSRSIRSAPLKIWNWDGKNLTLEKSYSWTGNIRCVYAGDADGDGKIELVTAGSMANSTGNYPSLRIWTWDGETLALRGSYEGKNIGSVSIGDVDGDGKPEIVTVGRFNDPEAVAQLSIWRWDGKSLALNASVNCCATKEARANSVFAFDLNNDGVAEIVTVGYANDIKNSSGQLRIWQFDGTDPIITDNAEWRMVDGVYSVDVAGNPMGNTMVSNVKVADVDGDGVPEIVTGGFTYNGTKAEGQLRIWNWSGGVLNLEKSQEWVNLDITRSTSISINDVDGDGKKEIVTSGDTAGYGSWAPNAPDKTRAELKVWSWDGNTLTLKQSKDWIVGEAVSAWNVGTGDVDNDGVVEIVTVGCMQTGNLCDPDLRIWSLPETSALPASFPYLPVAVVGAAATAIAAAMAAFIFMRKRRQ
jgi:hypothetical protein